MRLSLKCAVCGRQGGEYDSHEAWQDAARGLGWAIGRDEVLCRECLARAEPPPTGH